MAKSEADHPAWCPRSYGPSCVPLAQVVSNTCHLARQPSELEPAAALVESSSWRVALENGPAGDFFVPLCFDRWLSSGLCSYLGLEREPRTHEPQSPLVKHRTTGK